MNTEKNKIETLKKIRILGGKVYIRIREKRLTMTLRFGIATVTASSEYSAEKVVSHTHLFLKIMEGFES